MTLRSAALAAVLLLTTSACAQAPADSAALSRTEKFRLNAGPCAADGYSATILEGSFLNSQGGGFVVPSGHILEGNWGASGTLWAVGDELQAVPERLSMRWFSYAEDKFYQGEFTLPQEDLYRLLQQGSWDIEKAERVDYSIFTVCVLPGGVVVVWLSGGNQVLVGRFQGQEFVPTPEEYRHYYGPARRAIMVQEVRAEMPESVQDEIRAGPLSSEQWDAWLKPYPWQVALNVPFPLYRYSLTGLSAERTRDPLSQDGLDAYRQFLLTPTPKSIPHKLFLYGTAENGTRYLVMVREFDTAEVQAAFEALDAASPGQPLTLLFSIDPSFTSATLVLKNGQQQIPLTQSRIEVFSED